MAGPSIVVDQRALRLRLKVIGADVADMSDIHKRVAKAVAPIYASQVPVRSGRLRASTRGGGTRKQATIRVGGGAIPYAAPITFGWARHNIAANRWDVRAQPAAVAVGRPLYEAEMGALFRRHGAM